MPTSKSGPWQKLVPIACRLSDHVAMAATMKSLQNKKEWHCQLKSTRLSVYKFPCAQSESTISPLTVLVMFLTLSLSRCTWPLSVPLSGWLLQRGAFDCEHFLLFLSGTVWYAALFFCNNARLVAELKAGFVYKTYQRGNQSAWKVAPITAAFKFNLLSILLWKQPPTLTEGSESI